MQHVAIVALVAAALLLPVRAVAIEEDFCHTRTLMTDGNTELPLVGDLTDVTFVDSVGEGVLSFFGRLGAEFIADNAYARDLCERLNLPLSRVAVRTRRRKGAH